MKYRLNDEIITLSLPEKVETSNAEKVSMEINEILSSNKFSKVILDCTNLKYISSAGLRAVLKIKKVYDDTVVENASVDVYEIFDMTGFTEMMEVHKALRTMSVDGCPVIGKGAKGTVYRINEDTIIKVYNSYVNMEDIKREITLAKKAFILGIPTAISFDIVKVGDRFGSVFELLNAKSFTEMIDSDRANADKYIKEYTDILRQINTTDVSKHNLADYRELVYNWLDVAKLKMEESKYAKLKKLVDDLPDRQTMIHGDYHTNNLLYQNGEAILIDMDTLAHGHPIFELANIHIAYVGFSCVNKKMVEDFLGIEYTLSSEIWKKFLPYYLDTQDESKIKEVDDKVQLLSYTRLIRHYLRRELKSGPTEEGTKYIEFGLNKVNELLDKVDSLDF